MAQKIKFVTDSASDIPRSLREELDILVLPFPIAMGAREYQDGVDFTATEFYDMLLAAPQIPTHAQLTPFVFSQCFEEAFRQGYTDLIYTSINSKGSATHQNALQAREEFYEDRPEAEETFRIHILDSRLYTMAYGWAVGVFFILLVGFFLIGQSYGLLLALGLAMLDFIPIVGAGTIMVPWAFLALFTHDYAQAIQIMLIWGVIAMFRRVGEPKVVGDQTGLSPILSLVSIYVGMRLGGVLGMVLGPTVALIALNLVKLGLFEGLRLDLAAAAEDIMALLRERPEN